MSRWLVFTYGTLKRGEPNHYLMQKVENGVAEFVGEAETLKTYPLLIASRFNIPFLLDNAGLGEKVRGELYRVDQTMLAVLDELESHPDFYVRREEEVTMTKGEGGGEVLKPWIYFLPKWKPEMLQRPFLSSYSSAGPHGLPYVESDDIETAEDIDL